MTQVENANPYRPRVEDDILVDFLIEADFDGATTVHAWFKWPRTLILAAQAEVPGHVRPLVNVPLTGAPAQDREALAQALLEADFRIRS
jgi:hypothetical protein